MALEWLCIAIVGVCWGGYPLIARLSGLGGPLGTLVLASVAFVPVIVAVLWTGVSARPSAAQLWPLAVAGVMQGIGLLAFVQLANGRIEASVAIPITDVLMLLVTTFGALAFFHEALSPQKLLGIGLLVAGILLLRPT